MSKKETLEEIKKAKIILSKIINRNMDKFESVKINWYSKLLHSQSLLRESEVLLQEEIDKK